MCFIRYMRSDFSIRIDNKSPEWKRCLGAAQWIQCAYNMYCILKEAIHVSQIVEDAEQNMDDNLDNETSVLLKAAYENIITSL